MIFSWVGRSRALRYSGTRFGAVLVFPDPWLQGGFVGTVKSIWLPNVYRACNSRFVGVQV